jgi:hypothetical protein
VQSVSLERESHHGRERFVIRVNPVTEEVGYNSRAPAGERVCYANRTVTARPDAVISWEKRGWISCRTAAGRRSKMSR